MIPEDDPLSPEAPPSRQPSSVTATWAKQHFGELLKVAEAAPVYIERHGRVQGVMLSEALHLAQQQALGALQQGGQRELDARRAARQQQAQVTQRRLMRHQQVALALLTAPQAQAQAMLTDAKALVSRWAQEGLCSADYVQRWTALLALPLPQLALAMTGDADGWGDALRQNSPWVQAWGEAESS